MKLQNYEQAENYFLKVIQNSDDLSSETRALATTNLAYCYFKKNDFPSARLYFEKAEQFFTNSEKVSFDNLSRLAHWKGLLARAEKNLDLTEKYWTEALDYAFKAKNIAQQADVSREIIELLAEQKKFEDAYVYQQFNMQFLKKTE